MTEGGRIPQTWLLREIKDKGKRIRSNKIQLEMLVDYMKDNHSFAVGEYSGPVGAQKHYKQWGDLANILAQYGPKKSVNQWRHTWRDLKRKARDEANIIKHARANGDGTFMPQLSEISSKIMNIVDITSPVYLRPGEAAASKPDCWKQTAEPRHLKNFSQDTSGDVHIIIQEETGDHEVHQGLTEQQGCSNDAEADVGAKALDGKKSQPIMIAVIPEGFPAEQFQNDGWAAFVPIMFAKLEESSELPEVDVEGIIAGAIHISCKKGSDVAWLFNNFNGQVIDGRKVKVLNVKDLPKPCKMLWQTRNCFIEDNTRVLKLMQRAHPTLRTAEWKVTHCRKRMGQLQRTVLMDLISADYIKSAGYRLSNGMCTDVFVLLDEPLAARPRPNSSVAVMYREQPENEESSSDSKSDTPIPFPQPIVLPRTKREITTPSPIHVQEIWLMPQENGGGDEKVEVDVLEDESQDMNLVDTSHPEYR